MIATNTFTDGLVMDFNPAVTPSTMLTNSLNGTFITFNGNENILQNDMGNGRVDTAYLPEGYIPLGTTQFGGVIYIVSYNPETDNCQIGSFPSPQRNISSQSIESGTAIVDTSSFVNENHEIISTTYRLVLLDKEVDNLNPGDKYTIYSTNSGISNNYGCLSDLGEDCKEIIGASPKNVTIHVVSIDDDGKITYLDDSIKWDHDITTPAGQTYNYYIGDVKNEDSVQSDVDAKRSLVSSAYNTFRSKISGRLALLFKLNVLESFSMNVTYKVTALDKESDKAYIDKGYDRAVTLTLTPSYGDSKFLPAFIYINAELDSAEAKSVITGYYTDIKNSITLPKIYYEINDTKATWNFTITPGMSFGKLPSLSVTNSGYFSNLGSGKINVSTWRYYIQEDSIVLNWALEAYPEEGKSINNIILQFLDSENITDEHFEETCFNKCYQYQVPTVVVESTDTLKFTDNFQKDKLYLVRIQINYSGEIRTLWRWLYTTGQWNEQYAKQTCEDFDTLDLTETIPLELSCEFVDNIKPHTATYQPNLVRESWDDSNPYSSMTTETTLVNFNANDWSEEPNVYLNTSVKPSKYSSLFQCNFGDSIYTVTKNEEATYKETTPTISGEDKSYTEAITPKLGDSCVAATIVTEALQQEATANNNSKRTNFITVKQQEEHQFNFIVQGAIFNRINAEIEQGEVSVGQLIRPLIYTVADFKDYGFIYDKTSSGYNVTWDKVFAEGHRDLGGGEPFSFKFGYTTPSKYATELIGGDKSIKSTWNPGDEFSRSYYWIDTYPYTQFLEQYMSTMDGPFRIMGYSADPGSNWKTGDKLETWNQKDWQHSIGIGGKFCVNIFGVWVKTSESHYMPINCFFVKNGESETYETMFARIAHSIYPMLLQIYKVDSEVDSVQRFKPDTINYLSDYEATVGLTITCSVNVDESTMKEDFLIGTNSFNDISRALNTNNYLKTQKISTTNISKDKYTETKYPQFSHTFKISSTDLKSIYEIKKNYSIKSLYALGVNYDTKQEEPALIEGPSLNKNYLYIWDYNNKKYKQLSSSNVSNLLRIPSDSCVFPMQGDENSRVYIKYRSSDACYNPSQLFNAFTISDDQLSLDQDLLIRDKFTITYTTDSGYGRYAGNCNYTFIDKTKISNL